MQIVRTFKDIPSGVSRFEWMPGNGTRYDLLFGRTEYDDRLLLVWLHRGGSGGAAFHWSGDIYLHWTYMAEKMSWHNQADVAAMLAFLADFGIEVGMPESFNEEGLYRPEAMEEE